HRAAVDGHGLDQLEALAGPERVIRDDLLDFGVAHHNAFQAIPNVDQRVVLVGGALAAEDQAVLHDHGVAPALGPGGEQDRAQDEPSTERPLDCTIPRHAVSPRALAGPGRAVRRWPADRPRTGLTASRGIPSLVRFAVPTGGLVRWCRDGKEPRDAIPAP